MHFFALGALGKGLSGSDRIFIEFARRWSKEFRVNIYLWTEGYEMCQRQNLKNKNITFRVSIMEPWKNFGFVLNYFARILEGIRLGFTLNLKNNDSTILYSASDFWMDTLPCFILKLRSPKVKWVATWYQTAPNPFIGYAEGKREEKYRFKVLLYWLSQFPIKPLISYFADFVLVNNEEERKQFPELNEKARLIVVLGAVDLEAIKKFQLLNISHQSLAKRYDAVFQGRFHPQKGVVELIDIWKKVVDKQSLRSGDRKKPGPILAMIGDGPLMKSVKLKIKSEKLENNVRLFGYLFDGEEKYKIFAQSKIVVHPAFYDSGGMAAAEVMAFGLPCVGFNLKSYLSYYPKGMVKIKIGDLDVFAETILELLSDNRYREKLGREASDMIGDNWSWDIRAREILNSVRN